YRKKNCVWLCGLYLGNQTRLEIHEGAKFYNGRLIVFVGGSTCFDSEISKHQHNHATNRELINHTVLCQGTKTKLHNVFNFIWGDLKYAVDCDRDLIEKLPAGEKSQVTKIICLYDQDFNKYQSQFYQIELNQEFSDGFQGKINISWRRTISMNCNGMSPQPKTNNSSILSF
ncbi:hypothetical protein ACJX0J_012068, partial [Zea mays]